ncbi:MAG: hypothetical protein ACXABG_06845, partial [Promethearchaeota archaeon]
DFQSFYITDSAWGTASQKILPEGIMFTLFISYGEISLKSIQLGSFKEINHYKILSCKILNSEEEVKVEAILDTKDSKLKILFLKPICLKENQSLQVQLE